jgi:hypothetical protein
LKESQNGDHPSKRNVRKKRAGKARRFPKLFKSEQSQSQISNHQISSNSLTEDNIIG